MSTLFAAALFGRAAVAEEGAIRVYIGTYTGEKSKGIYLSQLEPATGALSPAEVAAEVTSPSFLAIHPSRKFVYAVSEVSESGGKPTGAVVAFAVDPKSGKLKMLNQQSSQGAGPCHLVVDATGKNVLVANYGSGSCAALPILEDGKLGEATAAIQHMGKSVKPNQQSPHAHSINLDAANRFAFVADLGLDKILVYKFDAGKGSLTANDPPAAELAPGSGPRHFAFHPTGKYAYVINEISLTVTAFNYDPSRGSLQEIQTISTLPEGFKGNNLSTAEVVVHPSGKFVYGSNRGHDSIVIYTVDASTGKLTYVGNQSTGGKTPRNFAIDPTGAWLLAENQGSGTIVVLQIDQKTGELKPTAHKLEVSSPVCVRMIRAGD